MRLKTGDQLLMIITPHILSIPPHLSTPWKNIAALRTIPEKPGFFTLEAILRQGGSVHIEHMDLPSLEAVFQAHARYGSADDKPAPLEIGPLLSFPVKPLELGFGSVLQHNPAQANTPEIPKEILEKIASLGKTLDLENTNLLPKPEPNCNCPFCQIARTLYPVESAAIAIEENVADADLHFSNWKIEQKASQLYTVSNPEDLNEQYSVFLGDPLGCTCGSKNCEHIKAVLQS